MLSRTMRELIACAGDTNGCDDDNFTGEASVAMANLCFPKDGLNGENGHDEHDILCGSLCWVCENKQS